MIWIILGYLFATISYLNRDSFPSLAFWFFSLLIPSAVLFWLWRVRRKNAFAILLESNDKPFISYLRAIIFSSGGFFFASIYITILLLFRIHEHRILAENFYKKSKIVGIIVATPRFERDLIGMKIKLKSINGQKNKSLIKINWYFPPPVKPVVGEIWHFFVRLKPIHSFGTPEGFRFERRDFLAGFTAKGYILKGKNANRLIGHRWFYNPTELLRSKFEKMIENHFTSDPYRGFLESFLIGKRNNLSKENWLVLQTTGTAHLVSIAGLHIGIMASICFFLFSFVWRVSGIPCGIPTQKIGIIGALIGAITYSLLAGFALPARRALIMLTVFGLSILWERKLPFGRNYILSLLLILIIWPFSPYDISFWFSFCAVFVIILASRSSIDGNKISKWFKIQYFLIVGLMPLSLYAFHTSPTILSFANAFAVPWFLFLIFPFLFAGAVLIFLIQPGGLFFWKLALLSTRILYSILKYISKWKIFVILSPFISLTGVIALQIAAIIFLLPQQLSLKHLIPFFFLPILFPIRQFHPKGADIHFSLLDVGHGLASIVQTSHHLLIFDCGPRLGESFDAGKIVVLPALYRSGVKKINKIIISHSDSDHLGGLKAILQVFPKTKVLTSIPKRLRNFKAKTCQAGDSWYWDGVFFQILWPPRGFPYQDNNSSCVLKVSNGRYSLIIPGDIEFQTEASLVNRNWKRLPTTILIAPHHGSKTSSSFRFLQATKPKLVLFATGDYFRFHIPNRLIEARYREIGTETLSTYTKGNIDCYLPKKGEMTIQAYRKKHKFLWQKCLEEISK